jgi:hypothetical protein
LHKTLCAEDLILVRFEVFTAVTMKKAVFWDVAPCRYGVNRRFGGTYPFHLQGRREIIRKSAREASVRDVRDRLPPKRRLTPYLHGATSQKTAFFDLILVSRGIP